MPGGVCAVLDYKIEQMAAYVSEMTIRVVAPQSSVTPSFRRFVNRVLTSTRLPRTTILLGMNYLAKRINLLNSQGTFRADEGHIWRLFTVSLLLASKFCDDNTFRNQSWSEVTGITVSELNLLERDWLENCCWDLYVNLSKSEDYQAWLASWDEWLARQHRYEIEQARAAEARAAEARAAEAARVAALEAARVAEYTRVHKLATLPSLQTTFMDEHGRLTSPCPSAQPSAYGANIHDFGGKTYSPVYRTTENDYWGRVTPESLTSTPLYVTSATASHGYADWFSQALRYQQPPKQEMYFAQNNSLPMNHMNSPWDQVSDFGCAPFDHNVKPQSYFAHNPSFGQPVMG